MSKLTKKDLAWYIDHTLLRADAGNDEIEKLCNEALQYNFSAVCVNPYYVELCRTILVNTSVKIAAVVGFPLGATLPNVKFYEAGMAILAGAKEIDMVLNIGQLKQGNSKFIEKEIRDIVKLAIESESIVKVIIETSLISESEKIAACKIVSNAGAQYIKTSTGFSNGGATIEDIKLMKEHCSKEVLIKASGGIKTAEDAIRFIEAGASRIGTSSGVEIVS